MKKEYIAIDQYGQVYLNLGDTPRKSLLEQLGYKHTARIYRDKKDGTTVFVGYIIGRLWLTIYEIKPFEKRG